MIGKTLSQAVCGLWKHKSNPWESGTTDRGSRLQCYLLGANNPKCYQDLEPTVEANSCIVDSSEHFFAGPAWTCPSSAACRSCSEPSLWAYSLHGSGQSELCCYTAPAGRAFPVLVSGSIAVHRHPFAIFVWIDFLKAPGNILFIFLLLF